MRQLLPVVVVGLAATAIAGAQPAATLSVERLLNERLRVPAADVARFSAGGRAGAKHRRHRRQ